jgi:hypothetical protein
MQTFENRNANVVPLRHEKQIKPTPRRESRKDSGNNRKKKDKNRNEKRKSAQCGSLCESVASQSAVQFLTFTTLKNHNSSLVTHNYLLPLQQFCNF